MDKKKSRSRPKAQIGGRSGGRDKSRYSRRKDDDGRREKAGMGQTRLRNESAYRECPLGNDRTSKGKDDGKGDEVHSSLGWEGV